MKTFRLTHRLLSLKVRSLIFLLVALAVVGSAIPVFRAFASDPPSGTLSPSGPVAPFTGTFRGTATGGASESEATCVEGVNCDTFTLTIGGSPADWTNKKARIQINWLTPATDYDLFLHKDSNAGPGVASSAQGTTTSEAVEISPSEIGTGVYTVHVVYFAGGGPGDQFNGTASVVVPPGSEPVVTGPASCTEPGTLVTNDPINDQTGANSADPSASQNQEFDLRSLFIAEPPGATNPLTFAISVRRLDMVPPQGVWRAQFTFNGINYFVAAESGTTGGPNDVTYSYGTSVGTMLTTVGAATGRVDLETQTFYITVPRAAVGNPAVGQPLTDVFARTQVFVGALGTGGFVNVDTTRNASDLKSYTIKGNAECMVAPGGGGGGGGGGTTPTSRVFTGTFPAFANFAAPETLGNGAGEPTLGVNWETGKILFIAGLEVLRVTVNDCTAPATALWERTNQTTTNVNTFDPILFTDNDTGDGKDAAGNNARTNRTFVSQLIPSRGNSFFEFTDNDGANYTVSTTMGGLNSGVDHQTVGGGPYARNPDGTLKGGAIQTPRPGVNDKFPNAIYPNAVYYASQDIALAELSRSDDGGLNFNPAVPMYTLADCNGLHGHVKVAQDGTVYVPNKSCTGQAAVVVSEDNGVTFDVRRIPGSTAGDNDPSVGIGAVDPATGIAPIYVGYTNGDGHPHIAVSKDRGLTFTDDYDAGEPFNIKLSVFPAVAAGDHDRASFFFLGTSTAGDGTGTDAAGNAPNTQNGFSGTWFGYIATTYDYGKTWAVVQATGKDPVQRGVVCTNGTTCPAGTRNLLDFNDLAMDAKGRPVAAFADGCISAGCINGVDKNGDGALTRADNDGTDKATIIRQSTGKTLLSAFDNEPAFLASPAIDVTFNPETNRVRITFQPIMGASGYKVFRTRQGGAEELLATLPADATSYEDSDPGTNPTTNGYRVAAFTGSPDMPTAQSGQGECAISVNPRLIESSCDLPGVTVSTDAAADTVQGGTPSLDLQTVSVSEPFNIDGKNRVTFSLKVASLSTPPTGAYFIVSNRQVPTTDPTGMAGTDRNYVAMRSSGGVATYEYGEVIQPSANTIVKKGDNTSNPDIISGTFTSDGLISITVVTDPVLENVQPGASISGIYGETFADTQRMTITKASAFDLSTDGIYQLIGSAACATPAVDLGLEGDVTTPLPDGDGVVNTLDAAQTQRYAVGLDSASLAMSNARQRADTAPLGTLGDGSVNTLDAAQTQRYAVGLDGSPKAAGGPGGAMPSVAASNPLLKSRSGFSTPQGQGGQSVVRVMSVTTGSNPNATSTVDVPVILDATGRENSVGFSLNYDPTRLSSPVARRGSAVSSPQESQPSLAQNALTSNNSDGTRSIGLSLLLPTNEVYAAGERQIVIVQFTVAQNAASGSTPITFGDTPSQRVVGNTNAQAEPATFQDGGTVTIVNPTAEAASVAGVISDARGRGIAGVRVSLTGSVERSVLTDRAGRYSFTDLPGGEAFTLRATRAGYAFTPSSRTVTTEGNTQQGTADFSAQPKRRRTFGSRQAEK